MNILLVHPKKDIADILSLPIESKFAASVGYANNGDAIREYFITNKKVPDFVVAQNEQEILNSLTASWQSEKKLNLILFDGSHITANQTVPKMNLLGFAGGDTLLADLISLIEKNNTLKKTGKVGDDVNFCRINTALLLKMAPLSADIYIRLSSTHYTKMFQKDDTFDEEDLKRYRDQKKVEYLFLSNEDCPSFVNRLAADLNKLLNSKTPPSIKTVSQTIDDTIETTHELINKVGVTEDVQSLVKTSMALAIKSMGEFPNLAEILRNITNNKGRYIGKHSMLLTNVACAIAVAMDWYSEATFEKLTMAAFMHDAGLDNQELCAVKDLTEFDKVYKGKFNLAQVQQYKGHPQKAALLLGSFKDHPAETDKIILQHHEHPVGSGFPNQLTANYIAPLAAVFIVAHDVTDFVIDNGKFNFEEFMKIFEIKYSSGNFKKIAKALAAVEF